MDKRISYYMGVDTETCNGLKDGDKLDLTQSLVYDIGWAIVDKRGNIYLERSFVVSEIFFDMKNAMKSAYYAEKLPAYYADIKSGKRKVASIYTIKKLFYEDCKEWSVKAIFAHNASFDVRAINNTMRYVTKSKTRYFFPYGLEIWDTLKMAKSVIAPMKTYIAFCEDNDYMTNHRKPQVRLTAEILYRYISKNDEFIESHTGLEDVRIESQILAYCYRQHKKMEKRLYS